MATKPRLAPITTRLVPSGTTTLDPVVTKLTTLGLEYPASALPELREQAAREDRKLPRRALRAR
jgi:hypothetical protein